MSWAPVGGQRRRGRKWPIDRKRQVRLESVLGNGPWASLRPVLRSGLGKELGMVENQ